jgi:hypothetical protein
VAVLTPEGPARHSDFLFYIRDPLIKYEGASFIGRQSIRTWQILLGFNPTVQKIANLNVTRLGINGLHGKTIGIRIFLANLARTMRLRMMR